MASTKHFPKPSLLLSGNGKNNFSLRARLSPLYFAGLLASGFVSVANAAIVADAGQASRPSISVGQNGATIVDINAAGNGGVSHNIFNKFDVDKNGVVLNNSVAGANSQLAGNIAGNVNLNGGAASVILNEVNSNNASVLNGMVEVGGQQAQVVIANPAGIACSGCGFINASRVTLTTGQAEFSEGNLQGYRVEKGSIIINGEGMKGEDANYTDLIARYVNVSSELKAKDLRVIVGRNTVSADTSEVTALKMTGSGGVNVGLDVAALGGCMPGRSP
ncbi:filamentous hemagglutinin N-terminal domain-containing protein [Serratia sp. L9]|uniref:filamentous hemagglutinin N-terminal domain-containing protein n=1 Tax=Serratia sp. L9 TaxID=3423946 RepID=UPI003D6755C4